MFSKTSVTVTYFKAGEATQHSDKMFVGRVSEGIKTTQPDPATGKAIYEFDSWNTRFVGKALEKAKGLENKTVIKLTEWAARNPYSKERERSYPYLLVTDFEVVPR